MLPNYDAKAVAEVMGLAFLRGPADSVPPAKSSGDTKRQARRVVHVPEADFVIHVDDDFLLMVEAKTLTEPKAPGTARSKGSKPESRLVSSPSSVFIEKAVEKGLPRTALRHVAESLAGDDKTKVSVLEWGIVPKTTLERREVQLSPQESERTERVARLFVHARRALGSVGEAREFMTTPHPELDGRSPIDIARTDLGTRRTEQLLNALEYGLAL